MNQNRIELQNPDDPNVKFIIEPKADGVYVSKEHTAITTDTVTIGEGVTQTTTTTVVTKTVGESVTF